MNIASEDKNARLRRSTDKQFMPKNERWALLDCVIITVIGTLALAITFVNSLPE